MGDVGGLILVITGTRHEAAALKGEKGFALVAGGGDAAGLRVQLDALLTQNKAGLRGIISFGMAGALKPGLAIGDWIVARRLFGAVDTVCDPDWAAAFAGALPGARTGCIYADGRMISDPAEKSALGTHHDADAADMESHVAAAFAAEHGLPFAIIRCISDRADHALPPAIRAAMRPDGALNIKAILTALLRQPAQIPKLILTLIYFAKAMAALRRGAWNIAALLRAPED